MLNERIKQRRKELNMTQEELAQKTGYKTKGAISRIEKGERDLSQSQISDFAKALNTTESFLMGWKEKQNNSLPKEFIPLTKIKKIPILGYAPCGSFSWAEEDFQGYFVADELIKADYCLVAKGDSMIDADINDGDIVFMKHTQEVENGRIAVVRIDDTVTLKKVIKLSDKVILQPYNNEYEPIILQDEPKASIVGEMVGVYKVR